MNDPTISKQEGCEYFSELTSAYRDGELSDSERLSLEKHMSECSKCADVLASVDRVAKALAHIPRVELERDIAADVEKMLAAKAQALQGSETSLQSRSASHSAAPSRTASGGPQVNRSASGKFSRSNSTVVLLRKRNVIAISAAAAAIALSAVAAYFIGHNAPAIVATKKSEPNSVSQYDRNRREVANTGNANEENGSPNGQDVASNQGAMQNQDDMYSADEQADAERFARESNKGGADIAQNNGDLPHDGRAIASSHPGERQSGPYAQSVDGQNNSQSGEMAYQQGQMQVGTSTAQQLQRHDAASAARGSDDSVVADTNLEEGNVFGQLGVGTDEDGLYAIKM